MSKLQRTLLFCLNLILFNHAFGNLTIEQVHVSLGKWTEATKWTAIISFASTYKGQEVPIDFEPAVNVSWRLSSDLVQHTEYCIMFYGNTTSYEFVTGKRLKKVDKPEQFIQDVPKYTVDGVYHSPSLHHVVIQDLPSESVIYYQVGLRNRTDLLVTARDEIFSFETPPSPGKSSTSYSYMGISVIGDLGQTKHSLNTRDSILSQIDRNTSALDSKPSLAMIVGDISYADGNATRWDTWGRLMEPLFARLPLMVLPGNHEIELNNKTKEPFQAYRHRFTMPGIYPDIVAPATHFDREHQEKYAMHLKYNYGSSFYSFNVGYCHIVALNVYNTHEVLSEDIQNTQEAFVKEDLAQVNTSETPFILVFLHAPLYNSNTAHQNEVATQAFKNWSEPLFHQYHVDAVFSGHVHAYERHLGMYQGRYSKDGTVYITVGDGGNHELLYNKWLRAQPANVFRDGRFYGHGEIRVHNRTHLEWLWKPNPAQEFAAGHEDRAWIRPYSLRQEPKWPLSNYIRIFILGFIVSIALGCSYLTFKSYSVGPEYSEKLLDETNKDGTLNSVSYGTADIART